MDKNHLGGFELMRLNLLCSLVSSILITGRSELRRVAIGNGEVKQFSSKVKQYKRLLMNGHIDMESHYLPYMIPLLLQLSKSGELVFSIDGSVVGKGCMCLMFSVIYQGKAIPVVWRVYKAKKGHLPEKAHRDVLSDLCEVVPENCRIIITGDGEFDGCKWQQDIINLGWNYVLRTGKGKNVRVSCSDNFKLGSISTVKGTDMFMEDVEFTEKKWLTNILVWHGKDHSKPLYLLTNLDFAPEIKRFYKKRFKIEPFFRDQKSKGFHIQKSGLRHPDRLKRLLIATCLAYVISVMAATKARKSIFYDKITRTDGEFLSLFLLGYRFILFLVDIRQWRAFSWSRDLIPDSIFYTENHYNL